MQKMQVFFPEPQLKKLRKLSREQDRPVSELIRMAVDYWLARQAEQKESEVKETPPAFSCGNIQIRAEELRDVAYDTAENRENE